MMKIASILKKTDKYIIYSESLTNTGISLATEPYFILPDDATSDEICNCIMLALSKSKSGINHPSDWKKQKEDFLLNMQEKSMITLHSKSIQCSICLDEETITIYPTINLGAKNGFENLKGFEITTDKNKLQDSIFNALSICR